MTLDFKSRPDPAPCETRRLRLRPWIRATAVALVACLSAAIWQDRSLAPGLHDGMTGLAASARAVVDQSDGLRAALAQLTGGVNIAARSDVDPVTALLLKAGN